MADMDAYTISKFHGGLSDEKRRGVEGGFWDGYGLDIHEIGRNSLSCNQALKKISGTTVDELINAFVPVDSIVYAFGNSGGVYEIDGESVTQIYTDSNGGIKDAAYFYGYIYWTTDSNLGRCDETSSDWSTDASPNWGSLQSCDYHPIHHIPFSDLILIGNDRYLRTINSDHTANSEALDLYKGWTVKAMITNAPKVLIGATNGDTAKLFQWDISTMADTYELVPGWEENDITEFASAIGAIQIFSDEAMFYFSGSTAERAKTLPSKVEHNATAKHNGKFYFGADKGVYSYHRRNKNYAYALNREHLISTDSESGINIGAMLGANDTLYVGWEDSGSYGIDIIDTSNKQSAMYEGLLFDGQRPFQTKNWNKIKVRTEPLPASTSVTVKYKMHRDTSWTTAGTLDSEDQYKDILNINGSGEDIQVKLELSPNGNDTPEVLNINTYYLLGGIYA